MKGWMWAALLAATVVAAAVGCSPVRLDCFEVGKACGSDGDCCSFGCVDGFCAVNPLEGGLCRTSADCRSGLSCEGGACREGKRADGDACEDGWACASGRCVDSKCTPRTDCSAAGATCGTSSECCTGLQCVGGKCSDVACKQADSACTESAQCCSGLGCASGACSTVCRSYGACTQDNDCCSGSTCMGGECRSSPGYRGDPCDTDAECQAGLRCAADADGTGKSCRPGQLGESCTSTPECDSYQGLVCTDGKCHYQSPQDVGAQCVGETDCTLNACDGTTGQCCRPSATACDHYYGNNGCCTGTVCLDSTDTCGACIAAGQPSQAANDCCAGLKYNYTKCCVADGNPSSAAGECCSGTSSSGTCCTGVGVYSSDPATVCCAGLVYDANRHTCVQPAGSTCTDWSQCEGGSYAACQGGKCCIEPVGSCDSNADCCSGTCTNGQCAPMPLGGSCQSDNQCDPATTAACSTDTSTCCAGMGDACGAGGSCCGWIDVGEYLSCGTTGTNAGKCCWSTGQTCTAATAAQCCSGICGGNGQCK